MGPFKTPLKTVHLPLLIQTHLLADREQHVIGVLQGRPRDLNSWDKGKL